MCIEKIIALKIKTHMNKSNVHCRLLLTMHQAYDLFKYLGYSSPTSVHTLFTPETNDDF